MGVTHLLGFDLVHLVEDVAQIGFAVYFDKGRKLLSVADGLTLFGFVIFYHSIFAHDELASHTQAAR